MLQAARWSISIQLSFLGHVLEPRLPLLHFVLAPIRRSHPLATRLNGIGVHRTNSLMLPQLATSTAAAPSGRVLSEVAVLESVNSPFLLGVRPAVAQQRPLDTQDPEPIGAGRVLVENGVTYARDAFYPLSGLKGNLWQLPVLGFVVGLSPIADFQLTGGPYNRLDISDRYPAPLAGLVTATGETTHAVEDITIGTKIRLLPEAARRPGVGFRFAVRLPNAKHESGMGQDTTDFSASILAGKTVASVRVVGNAGFTIMSEPLDAAKQNDVVIYGVSVARALLGQAELVGEINGRWSTRNGIAPVGTESRGTVKVGGRCSLGSIRLDAAVLFGITSIDPSIGVTAGFTYTFRAFSQPSSTNRQ